MFSCFTVYIHNTAAFRTLVCGVSRMDTLFMMFVVLASF